MSKIELDWEMANNWPSVALAKRESGVIVKVFQEEDPRFGDPRDASNVGTMMCEHRDYNLGDDIDVPDSLDKDCPKCDGSGEVAVNQYATKTCDRCEGSGYFERSLADYLREEYGARVALPLFLYEHGGITIRSGGNLLEGKDNFDRRGRYAMDGAGWDTSSVGVIFDTPKGLGPYTEGVEGCIGKDATDERILEALEQEVSSYALYLEGQVYGYVVENEDGEHVDSCGGFLGYWDDEDTGMLDEIRAAVEGAEADQVEEANEAAQWAARDTVTV